MVTERDILSQLKRGYALPPAEFRVVPENPRPGVAAILEMNAQGKTTQFEAEFQTRSTPKAFEDTLLRIQQRQSTNAALPLVVAPYLREGQLQELFRRGVSGIDLSGNGVVSIADEFLIYRTGNANLFPDSLPSKYVYRGATSLVARVFLCRPEYTSLTDIEREIRSRRGAVVKSTISKALRRLEEDVVVGRAPSRLWLRQADKLLDLLAESFIPPKVTRRVSLRIKPGSSFDMPMSSTPGNPLSAWRTLADRAAAGPAWTFSGRASLNEYAILGRDETPQLYTSDADALLRAWSGLVEETSRFFDFELLASEDPTLYFDRRRKEGVELASPVQVFLECSQGDKREQEAGEDVRAFILRELKEAGFN